MASNLRPGQGDIWPVVRPRPDDAATVGQVVDQSEDGVGVHVVPAADGQHRDLDPGVVLAH